MAGLGTRFKKAGFTQPKPLIDVCGQPMIARVLENLKIKDARFTLIHRKEHSESIKNGLGDILSNLDARLISIEKPTEGALCTILFAHRFINNENMLLLANSDQVVDMDINAYVEDMINRKLDGSILTFRDNDKKWSYARLNKENLVVEVKEKEPISEFATVGLYLFRRGRQFVEHAIDMIVENYRVNNEFYTAPVYNFLIRSRLKIGIFNIDKSQMHGLGTPEDLEIFLKRLKGEKCTA